MLETLKINNVALIKSLEIKFNEGFNVILGETGAGKSIIFDSLNFVLGDKADKNLIRSGEEFMKVSLYYSSISENTKKILKNFDIECYDDVVLQRTYYQNGKGEARANGELISISMLKAIGDSLVNIYGQNESVSLLKQKNHLNILDEYKSQDISKIKLEIEEIASTINVINQKLKDIGGSKDNRERQIDLLKYQINEIEIANIKEKEDEELDNKLTKIANSEKIVNSLNEVINLLENEDIGSLNLLRKAISNLINIESYDNRITNILKIFQESLLNVEDNISEINKVLGDFDYKEQDINKLIERKDLIDNLKRKYGKNLNSINEFLQNSKVELEKLENADELMQSYFKQKSLLMIELKKKYENLSQARQKIALELEERIENGLRELGMTNSKFKVKFNKKVSSLEELDYYDINSYEDVEFLFSANLGEELKPLSKTISGGEMNRFMLVYKNIVADNNFSHTIIFDEIDSGISGNIAIEVSKKIAKLAKNYQILCISHLSQVVSMGDYFYFVEKYSLNNRTETSIKSLQNDEIIERLAILTYGNVDDKKFAMTKELLENNKNYKMLLE